MITVRFVRRAVPLLKNRAVPFVVACRLIAKPVGFLYYLMCLPEIGLGIQNIDNNCRKSNDCKDLER